MALDTFIDEVPRPPRGRLTFPVMLARMVSKPIGSLRSADRDLQRRSADRVRHGPQLIQDILLDDAESHRKNPIDDHVRGGGGKGLLIAEDGRPEA
jgi:hypothetical protein